MSQEFGTHSALERVVLEGRAAGARGTVRVVADAADAAGHLPVCADRAVVLCADEKSSPRQARERRVAVKRLRILLVEDKWRVAQRLKVQLERLGHEVVGSVTDGEQAVGFVWRLEPDLIIMQQHVPIIDGIETAQTILAHKPIPIILLTAYAAADFVRQAREVGVMAYLATPGETRPLGPIIKVALARFEELEAIRREVSNLKDALKTRTLVEQAKRVLMRRQKLSEPEAFRNVQQQGRRTGTSLGESAAVILRTEELLFKDVNVVQTLQSTLTAIHRGLRSTVRRPRRDAL